jgi:hypothetical protein
MGIAAPVIVKEMQDWTALGGGNSGIVGDAAHSYGFHVAANELPSTDYSRTNDPNGSDGPYVNWSYSCAGDFDHKNNESLRSMHRNVLARLMRGELPMICEFIGKPWTDQPVYYWARWNGVTSLQRYTGAGHDHWSHISWYRSRVDQRAYLWTSLQPPAYPVPPSTARLRQAWPKYMPSNHYFGLITGPPESHGGYYTQEKPAVQSIQQRLISLGYVPGVTNPASGWADGKFEQQTKDAVTRWQRAKYAATTSRYGEVWQDDWVHLFTY